MVFGWFSKEAKPSTGSQTLPTVRFDSSRVKDHVKSDLWANIQELEDLPLGSEQAVYDAALRSILKGRALDILSKALVKLDIPTARASEITLLLHNRATAMMALDRQLALGLTKGKWLYSGAPCYSTRQPTTTDLRRDAAHKAANGKIFPLIKGLVIDGRTTHPGREPGCKCVTNAVIPGLERN
jgi:hypothetical protein